MSRIDKKHWNNGMRERTKDGIYVKQRSLCGREFMFGGFANAKRKVTCKNCRRLLGNPLTLGDTK